VSAGVDLARATTAPPIQLKGLYPAPVIPLDENLELLEREFILHVQRLARVGWTVGGVVVNGHAGEVTALDRAQRVRIIELARLAAPVGCHVIAGIESLSTTGAIELVKDAKEAGADAALVFPPFDYFPRKGMARTVEAPVRFFSAIAEAVDFPLIVFQYPLWTDISYTTETLVKLAEIDTVIGVKNASWDVPTYKEQYDALEGKVAVLAAADGPELIDMLAHGADGALIGVSNVGTALWARVVRACLDGRPDEVRGLFTDTLVPLAHALFGDVTTGSKSFNALMKEALVQIGYFSTSRVLGPELDVTDDDRESIRLALVAAELIPGS
jgi:4-hydroxy-tetrahydrodipicolinate synthase